MKAAWQPVASVAISMIPASTPLEGQRGGDGLDDRIQRLVLAADAVEDVTAGDR